MRRTMWIGTVVLLSGCAPAASRLEWVGTVRWSQGDSARWAQPGTDDAAWRDTTFWSLPHPDPVLWMRARVRLEPRPARRDGTPPPGQAAVAVTALASHELWWDGVRIGGSGTVGRTARDEIPGPVETRYALPDSLSTPGTHLLALRASAFHQHFTPASDFLRLGVGPLEQVVLERREGAWAALVSLSGMLLAALLAFVTFALQPRDRASLLLGLLALAVAALLGVEAWRPLAGYSYDHHLVRLLTLAALTGIAGALLGTFLVARFPRPGGRRALLVYLGVLALPLFVSRSWDGKTDGVDIVAFTFAAVWTALAVRARRRGALPALVGALVALAFLAWSPRAFLDRNVFFAVDALLACLLVGHVLEWHDGLAAREQALARSARLEAELLKRHLQPHFVMNTLTAVGAWIEEDPPTAVRMIDALAEELRLLIRIADRRLIPLADELRLCRAHLETLALRRETRYRLETPGVDETELVPPALLHTLVENAVTHGPSAAREVVLRLEGARVDGRRHYVFTSPRGEAASADPEPGTGTRYLIARLREAWGDDWRLTQEAAGDVWRVAFDLPGGPATGGRDFVGPA